MNEHSWFIDRIESAVAGGLLTDERERFDAHAGSCEACASLLAAAAAEDRRLQAVFAAAAPSADLEQRVIDGLRQATAPRRPIHPAVRRAAIAAAALLCIGTTGYVYDSMRTGRYTAVSFIQIGASKAPVPVASNLRQMGQALLIYANDGKQQFPRTQYDNEGTIYGHRSHRTDNGEGFATNQRAALTKAVDANPYQGENHDNIYDAPRPTVLTERETEQKNFPLLESRIAQDDQARRDVDAARADTANQIATAQTAMKEAQDNETKKDMTKLAQEDQVTQQRLEQEKNNKDKALKVLVQKLGQSRPQAGEVVLGGSNSFSGGIIVNGGEVNLNANASAKDDSVTTLTLNGGKYDYASPTLSSTTISLGNYHTGASPAASTLTLLNTTVGNATYQDSLTVTGKNLYADYPASKDLSGYNESLSKVGAGSIAMLDTSKAEKSLPSPKSGQGGQAGLDTVLLPTVEDQGEVPQRPSGDAGANPNTSSTTPPAPPPTAPASTEEMAARKIIRTGSMEFEVDSFDSAAIRLQKITEEENGFIGATDSNRLPNGKVQGTIVVRVPPENLEVLVLKLRGLGDLKSQKITAADVTKQFTDMDSELRAARAMETRLLAIIKDGKGEVKDLLEAEKELAVWREKIESVEGEMRYINSQVALSTLTITLTERDIKAAAAAFESEQVTLSVEAEKVDESYVKAKDAILDAKGRIVESELKQYEPGQFGAKIIADVGPADAEALIGRLRQLPGRVAMFNRERKQTTENGQAATLGVKVEQRDTRFEITLYNVATIAPRHATSVVLAATDVDQAVKQITAAVTDAGGRMLGATTTQPSVNQVSSLLRFDVPTEKAAAVLLALHTAGEVSKLETTENSDTANSTTVKEGFAVQILALAMVAPRHATSVVLASPDVENATAAITKAVSDAGGRILGATTTRPNVGQISSLVRFDIPADKAPDVLLALHSAGEVSKLETSDNADTANSTTSKEGFVVQILSFAMVLPRDICTRQVATNDVASSYQAMLNAAHTAKARVIASSLDEQDQSNITGYLDFEIARQDQSAIETAIAAAGETIANNVQRSLDGDNVINDKVQYKVNIVNAERLAPRETTTLSLDAADVEAQMNDIIADAIAAHGRSMESTVSKENDGRESARVIVDVPLDQQKSMLDALNKRGVKRSIESSRNPLVPDGKLARARFDVTLANPQGLVDDASGPWKQIREGLSTGLNGLLMVLKYVIIGMFFAGPVLILWGMWRLVRRKRTVAKATT